MFIRVLLPAPFSPSKAWISPERRSKSTSSLATMPGKALTMPRASSAGTAGGTGAACDAGETGDVTEAAPRERGGGPTGARPQAPIGLARKDRERDADP